MINKIISKLRSNWMVILPIGAALASFILSFWLKVILTPAAYGDFATAFFIVNVMLGLGVIGYDQVIIRLSKLNEKGLEIDRVILLVGGVILVLTPGLSFAFLKVFGVINEFTISYALMSWTAAGIAILAIVFNLQGRLLESYLFLGTWKILLLLIVAALYSTNVSIGNFDSLILISLAFTFFWLAIFRRKILNVTKGIIDSKTVYLLYFSSVVSLISYQAFSSLDRYLIISNFDKVVFGDYFFIFNFILAPTTIFVTYYTVQRLKLYKSNFSYSMMIKDYARVSFFSLFSGSVLMFIIFFANHLGYISYNSLSAFDVALIYLLCVVRNGYAILAAAYKIFASKNTLIATAILFGVFSLFFYMFFQKNVDWISIRHVLVSVIALWSLRVVLYFFIIKNDYRVIDG